MKAVSIVILTTILSFNLSCNSSKKSTETKENEPLEGTFKVEMLQEKSVAEKELELTFNAEDNSFNGTTECNSIFGTYKAEGQKITFQPVGATKMYCEGKMESEKNIKEAFAKATRFTVQKGKVSFYNAEDKLLLSASKQ